MKKWSVVILLSVAQFVMILDSTVMNVSISQLVVDLNTSVVSMQAAITCYTLTMAAFMLIGAKLCRKMGYLQGLIIGSIIYGIGSFITGISQNFTQLFVGWSVIEGLGAVLVIPAIVALVASNYEGKDRATAFAAIGASTGIAAAAGPLIGGFMTTYASWRYVFIAETIVMIILLIFSRKFKSIPGDPKAEIPFGSALVSVLGMSAFVLGILQTKTWGLISPLGKPVIGGQEIAPFGISLCAYLILGGIVLLKAFINMQQSRIEKNQPTLLDSRLLDIKVLRSGLSVLMSQYAIIAGAFFIIPVYLQMVLGYNAMETGLKLMPLSLALIIATVVGTKLVSVLTTRRLVRVGQLLLIAGSIVFLASIAQNIDSALFAFSLFLMGGGFGILASRIGDINMSTVGEDQSSEVGGLQGSFQNLGSSLGAALIGSILVMTLTTGFVAELRDAGVPANIVNYVEQETKSGAAVVPPENVYKYAINQGVSESEAQEISDAYERAELGGLQDAAFMLLAVSVLSLFFSRNLPNEKKTKRPKSEVG